MEHAEVALSLCREMPPTRHNRLPERSIIRPSGKDLGDGRIVEGRLALDVVRHGPTLPLHPGVEDPQEEVKDALRAQFALRSPLGHRQGRQEKGRELWVGKLDRNRRRYRLCCHSTPSAMASWEAGGGDLEKRMASDTTRG
jgi:hypothetical protein